MELHPHLKQGLESMSNAVARGYTKEGEMIAVLNFDTKNAQVSEDGMTAQIPINAVSFSEGRLDHVRIQVDNRVTNTMQVGEYDEEIEEGRKALIQIECKHLTMGTPPTFKPLQLNVKVVDASMSEQMLRAAMDKLPAVPKGMAVILRGSVPLKCEKCSAEGTFKLDTTSTRPMYVPATAQLYACDCGHVEYVKGE